MWWTVTAWSVQLVFAFGGAAYWSTGSGEILPAQPSALRMECRVARDADGDPQIEYVIINDSQSEVGIMRISLPFNYGISTLIVAALEGRPVEAGLELEAGVPTLRALGWVTIPPGGSYAGEAPLSRVLREDLRVGRYDITGIWCPRLKRAGGVADTAVQMPMMSFVLDYRPRDG